MKLAWQRPALAGKVLKETRSSLGLSLAQLGELVGLGKKTLIRWEAEGVPEGKSILLYALAEVVALGAAEQAVQVLSLGRPERFWRWAFAVLDESWSAE